MNKLYIANEIKKLRGKKYNSQRGLSDFLEITQPCISKFLNGYRHSFANEKIRILCIKLGISIEEEEHVHEVPEELSRAISQVVKAKGNYKKTMNELTTIIKSIGKI